MEYLNKIDSSKDNSVGANGICFMNENCVINWCSLNGACTINCAADCLLDCGMDYCGMDYCYLV